MNVCNFLTEKLPVYRKQFKLQLKLQHEFVIIESDNFISKISQYKNIVFYITKLQTKRNITELSIKKLLLEFFNYILNHSPDSLLNLILIHYIIIVE